MSGRTRQTLPSLLLSCSLCLVVFPIFAHERKANANTQEPVIHATTSRVLVDVLVEDKKTGEPIVALQQQDFLLRDNGKPVSVASFNRGIDHNLRPVQLWFVLLCNEERYRKVYRQSGDQVFASTVKESLGSRFLAGRAHELRPAFDHLKPDETVGVAHWCDDGEAETDAAPSVDRDATFKAIESIAGRDTVVVRLTSKYDTQERAVQMINNLTQAAFPEPFLAILLAGGNLSGNAGGNAGEAWSGFLKESSLEFGLQSEISPRGATQYPVRSSDYVSRLGAFIDSLHGRYEIGFAPGKPENKLHFISVELTRNAKVRFPSATLRYRQAYDDLPLADATQKAKGLSDWQLLDTRMRAAIHAAANQEKLPFDVEQARDTGNGMERFALQVAPGALTWQPLPNGDQRSVIAAVVASYSAQGQPVALVVKQFEVVQEFDRLPELQRKPLVFLLSASIPEGTARIRLALRDLATGRIGTRDLNPLNE